MSPDAAIRTLAYVVTECHDRPGGSVGRQRLEFLRGSEPEPIRIKELGAFGPIDATFLNLSFCHTQGAFRLGHAFLEAGVFQRLGVSPDGTRVAFEVTDAFVSVQFQPVGTPVYPLPEGEKGIFVVSADGSGLRRLAPPSHDAPFRIVEGLLKSLSTIFSFSPDGRTIAYTDLGRGPEPEEEEAIQVVTLDLDTAERRQVTHLPPGPVFSETGTSTLSVYFVDDETIAFFSTSDPGGLNPEGALVPFTVSRDGTNLALGLQPEALPDSEILPQFVITGSEPSAVLLSTTNPPVLGEHRFPVLDLFALDGDNLLQLTKFGVDDITEAVISADGQRVFFNASVDPCENGEYEQCTGRNPLRNCQIFSVDRTGGELHQITDFGAGAESNTGCYYNLESTPGFNSPFRGCAVSFLALDPLTGTLAFYSSCNLYEETGFIGAQLFAMRSDGTGLRQLTRTRGLFADAEGFYVTELPGPLAYSSSSARSFR